MKPDLQTFTIVFLCFLLQKSLRPKCTFHSLFVLFFWQGYEQEQLSNRTFSSSTESQRRWNNIVFLYSQILGSNSIGYNFEIYSTYLSAAISSYYLSIYSII